MAANQFSSGDVIADRRADYARMLAENGDSAAAVELMEQSLELAPDWAAGYSQLADYAIKAGRTEAAAQALRKLQSLDPEGMFAASLKLALIGADLMPDAPPSRYVEALFDDYADRFDVALVERLNYSVPTKLAGLIADNGDRNFSNTIDLGCGTGLFGAEIRSRTGRLEGFDLSQNMLARAAEKGLYDHLGKADLSLGGNLSGLFGPELGTARADLVSAADVLMYLGDLANPFALAAALLEPGGLFAFSVEYASDEHDFLLAPSLRYAHGQPYVRARLADCGMQIVDLRRTHIRMDGGKPITGILFLAQKTI